MMEIRETAVFRAWLDDLAAAAIAERIQRFGRGLFGDVKPVGEGVWEARVHLGPGYRVYYNREGSVVVVLLCGGDKRSQRRDIATARKLAETL